MTAVGADHDGRAGCPVRRDAARPLANAFADRAAADPYPVYDRLRRDAPVCPVVLPDGRPAWLVTRYHEARQVLSDPRFVKVVPGRPLAAPGAAPLRTDVDAVLRRVVARRLAGRSVMRLADTVRQLTADLLADLCRRRPPVDLVSAYAVPLPITVISDLLGVPDDERADLHAWSTVAVAPDQHRPDHVVAVRQQALAHMADLVRAKRRSPCADLISDLIAACPHDADQALVHTLWGLVMAGHETTTALIATGVLLLLCHPDQLAALRADPALGERAVEEILRYDGPAELAPPRVTATPVCLGDVTLPAGAVVIAALGSANRDETVNPQPARFQITRSASTHLAFGHGPHHCLGETLARLQGRIAITTLVHGLPGLRIAVPVDRLSWRPTLSLRAPQDLPVTW